MSEHDHSEGYSNEEATRISTAIVTPSDPAFYERTAFEAWDILVGLQTIIIGGYLPDEGQELVRAVRLALLGLHPKFRLNFEKPKGDSTFSQVAKFNRHKLATDISQEIDLAVARGAKLEAEVQDASDRLGISRREIFRMIKETRERRRAWEDIDKINEHPSRTWPLPDGFTIDPAGKIVPSPD